MHTGKIKRTKDELMISETANPIGVNVPGDYNSYAGSLGSAMVRSSAIKSQKTKTIGGR